MAARVQGAAGSNGTSADIDVTISVPGAGNTLVAVCSLAGSGTSFTSVTLDPTGTPQAFTMVYEYEGSTAPGIAIYALPNAAAAGTTVRMVKTGAGGFAIIELSGMPTTLTQDSTTNAATAQGSATAGDSGAGVTTTNANDVLIGGLSTSGGVTSQSGSFGGTAADTPNPSSSTSRCALFYRIVSATGTYDSTSTWTTASAWSEVCAAFQQAAAAGLPPGLGPDMAMTAGMMSDGAMMAA